MTKATILIPDISGFTKFVSETEIKHSSHIINELLETIVESNTTGFYVAEIEGDAVLMYRKGDALEKETLLDQCIAIFRNFHTLLKVIERDSICQCGACRKASNLSLKFVVHYGTIQEIKVQNFLKASGVDMIVAHRLLKNNIEKHEYILLSKPYLEHSKSEVEQKGLTWRSQFETYDSIGKVEFEYAYLDAFLKDIPEPPPPEPAPLPAKRAKAFFIEIEAPMLFVYQNLIDTDKRSIWVSGMTKLEREQIAERVGMAHYCLTDGIGIDHYIINSTFGKKEVTYVEKAKVRESGFTVWDYYIIERLDENRSLFSIRFAFQKRTFKTWFIERFILFQIRKNFEGFRKLCEEEFQKTKALD